MMESGGNNGGGSSDPLLAPGFRFYPTEEELLTFYLRHRLAGTRPVVEHLIPVVDIYGYHPSELQSMAGAANVSDTEQWFFFCPRAERELHGGRPARTTPSGYWKATGSPSYVYSSSSPAAATSSNSRVIGEKRTMVFYQGRAPTGNKTIWKMNEYKAVAADDIAPPAPGAVPILLRNEFSVCRVYISTGTLRSFDRRPLNNPRGDLAVAVQQDVVHYGYQQLQLQPLPPPAPAVVAVATRHQQQQMLAAVGVVDDAADHNGRRAPAANSHDSSSSGSQGVGGVDGAEDAATAIDWDSLIIPPVDDGLAFGSGVDDLTRVIWPHHA